MTLLINQPKPVEKSVTRGVTPLYADQVVEEYYCGPKTCLLYLLCPLLSASEKGHLYLINRML